jgi:hypothetical protein
MSTFDSADLVVRFKNEAGLAAANELNDITDICARLSTAQKDVIDMIAQRHPNPLYQVPVQLTSSDGGYTYGFGTDAQGNAVMPLGWVQIAPNKNGFSGKFFVGWVEGRDFLDEGTVIRMPSGRAYTGSVWARFVPTPPDIYVAGSDAAGNVHTAVQPILNPASARTLIVIRSVQDWAGEGNINPALANRMQQKWTDKFPALMLTYRTRYKGGGGLIDPSRWWLAAPDIGSTG